MRDGRRSNDGAKIALHRCDYDHPGAFTIDDTEFTISAIQARLHRRARATASSPSYEWLGIGWGYSDILSRAAIEKSRCYDRKTKRRKGGD